MATVIWLPLTVWVPPMTRVAMAAREVHWPEAVWRAAQIVLPEVPDVLVNPDRPFWIWVVLETRTVVAALAWTRVTTRLSVAPTHVRRVTGAPPRLIVVSMSPLRMFCSSTNEVPPLRRRCRCRARTGRCAPSGC